MHFSQGRKSIFIQSQRWYFSALVMLGLYLSTFVSSSAVLPHTHFHHEEPITLAGEHDPCHITLFHPGMEGGCHHKTHLTNSQEECKLSHITLMREAIPGNSLISNYTFLKPGAYYFLLLSDAHAILISQTDRGPPNHNVS